jgi:hypothetical protein
MKWQIVCKLVMGSAYEIIYNRLGSKKSVQHGYQNNSQCCINKHVWTSANNISIAMVMTAIPSQDRMIIGDETWIHHCEPEGKQ